jgi:hypothetical protein
MTLNGLPDFDQPLQGEGFQIFFPFEGGEAVLLPDELELAIAGDGRPDFALELVRRLGRFGAGDTYGLLDMRAAPRDRADDALALLRATSPAATLRLASFAGGYMRLQLPRLNGELAADLPPPVALAPDGLAITRLLLRVSPALAALIKGALAGEQLPLTAVAELALLGVSPRLPLSASFDPAALLAALLARADAERRIARAAVVECFRQDPAGLSIELSGAPPEGRAEALAQALADRALARFGALAPAPGDEVQPTFALAAPETAAAGRVTWELAEPCQALRVAILRLDPLAAARELAQSCGLDAAYRELTVPAFPTGALAVTALANLPDQRPGVLEIGVTLIAPPDPPRRPQAAVASAALLPPDDRATLALALGAGAAPAYRYTTYAALQQDGGVTRLDSPEREHAGAWLSLTPDDFPVEFVSISADRILLDLAVVSGTLAWGGSEPGARSFALDPAAPALALALPRGAPDAALTIEAQARAGARTLRLGPLPAKSMRLGTYSFAEYGPHTVEVTCTFDDASQIYAIELATEDQMDAKSAPVLLMFTPARPSRSWTWFARSPFAPGYRYRPRREAGQPPAPWSEVQSPFVPLNISSVEIAENAQLGV